MGWGALPAPPQQADNKLYGMPPETFLGNHSKVKDFITQWEQYWSLNYNNALIRVPYTRAMLFLTYVRGDLTTSWTASMGADLNNEVRRTHNCHGCAVLRLFLKSLSLDMMAHDHGIVHMTITCQDPVHGGSYVVPGCAYRLLGLDCPIVVSRDLLCCHMVFAYSSVVCRYVSPLATAFIDAWGCTSTLSLVVD